MEENLDFLGRDAMPSNIPQVDAMDVPDFGYAGQVINAMIPSDLTTFGIDDNKYYSGNSVNRTISNQDTAQRLFQNAVITGSNPNPEISGYSNPSDYNRNNVSYDRYYNHPKFKELGFSPFRDNESLYNQNASWGDEYNRMFGQFGKLFATGFTSSIESLGDVISGNPTKLFDESAGDYSKAAEIGMTTKGGVLGFANNLVLNSGYTVGILSEIALEELALGALTVGTGGAGGGVAATRTASNLGKLSRIGEMFTATRGFVQGLDKASDARRFWESAGKFLNPFENTVDAYKSIKQLNTGKNAVYRLDNAAKATKYFGSFYRDIRNMNAALGESKLEGGMVRDEVYKTLMQEYKENNDFTLPEGQDHQDILDQSQKAGFQTEMTNLPLIYFSNKIAFDNILNGYKPLQRALTENTGIVGDALRKTTVKGVPQYVRKKLTDVITLPFTDPKAALKSVLGTGARYSMTNLTEGFQELAQETISDAYKNFYIDSFKDPSLVHKNYMSTSINESINRQVFSSQGLETFMSGFLMGGVAGPFGKFMYTTLPAAGKYLTDREGYKTSKLEKEKLISDTELKLNTALANPFKVFTKTDENFVTQKAIQKRMEDAAAKGEQLTYQDAKDEALFAMVSSDLEKSKELRTLAETGELDTLRDHIEKLEKLSDEDFKQAYGFSAEEKNKKVQETLERIDSLKDASEQIEERFGGNPFRPDFYKPNSAAYINEMQQYKSWEAAKSHLLYQMYAQNRAVERKAGLLESAIATPLFQGMAASDFNIMFDPITLDAEVDILAEEIKNMGAVVDPVLKKQLEFKKKKEALLRKYKETYDTGLKKDGTYDMRKVNGIYKIFRDYVDLVKDTQSPKDIIKDANVQEVFSKLFDYKILDSRQQILEQSVNILMDPNYFKQLADRLSKVTVDAFNKVKEDLNTTLSGHMDLLEKNEVMASLKELGVLVEPDQALDYIKTGKIPSVFYHESVLGPVSPEDPIFVPIAQLFAIKEAKDSAEKEQSKSSQSPKDPKQKGQDPNDFSNIPGDPLDEDVSEFTMAVINRLYEEYAASLSDIENIETKEEFFNRKKVQDIVKAIGEIEKIYNDLTVDKKEFEEWLSDHKLSNKIQDILLKYNLSFNDIFKRVSDPNSFNNSTLDEETQEKVVSIAYKGVFVVSITTPEGLVYAIVDKDNNLIQNIKIPNNEEKNIKVSGGPYFLNLDLAIEVQKIVGDYLESTKQSFNFNGVTFKTGDIINDGKNDYIIISKPENIVTDPTTLNVKNIKTGSLIPLKSLSGYSKGARSTFDKSTMTSKLNTVNSLNKMWGSRLENETQQQANQRLSDLLLNTPFTDLVRGLSIRFSKTGNSLSRYTYLELDDQRINYNFGFFRDPYSIEVMFGGETIGYLPNATSSAFLDNQGNPLNINQLTVDKFKQAFYTTGSYNALLDQYKASIKSKMALVNYLKSKLADKQSIDISIDELSKFAKINLLSGEYDFLPIDAPRTKFSELNTFTVDGGIYIINREKKYKDGIMTDIEAIPITDLDSEKADALTKEINDIRFSAETKDPLSNYGRYVAVVRLPNGKIRFVELSTEQFTEIEQEEFTKSLIERIEKTKAENVDENGKSIQMEYNDVWNKNNINNKLFIALPLSKKGQFINFYLTSRGGIQIEFINKNPKNSKDVIIRKHYINDVNITSFNDLLITLNNGIKAHDEQENVKGYEKRQINIILTKDNFKQSISKNSGIEEFLALSTSVGPDVAKNISLSLIPKSLPSDVEIDPLNLPKDPNEPSIPGNIDMSSAPAGPNAITPDLLRGTASGNPKAEPAVVNETLIEKVQRRQREADEAMSKKKSTEQPTTPTQPTDAVADIEKRTTKIISSEIVEKGNRKGQTRTVSQTNSITDLEGTLVSITEYEAKVGDTTVALGGKSMTLKQFKEEFPLTEDWAEILEGFPDLNDDTRITVRKVRRTPTSSRFGTVVDIYAPALGKMTLEIKKDDAKYDAELAALEQPTTPTQPVTTNTIADIESFETAKGSVYTVLPDGRTQRFKTATGEQNEPNDLIVFVKFKNVQQEQDFLSAQNRQDGKKLYVIDSAGNVYDTNEQVKGKDVKLAIVKDGKVIETVETSLEPKIGYNTFDQRRYEEKGEKYRSTHLGNKVTKINAKYDAELARQQPTAPTEPAPTDTKATAVDLNIFDQVKQVKDQIDDEIDRVRKELLSQAGDNLTAAQKREIRAQAENAPSVKALEEQLKNLEKKLPFKVVEAGYTPSDIVNINEFVTWVKNNLPDFITVEDLNTIANNIINQGKTVGAFVQGFRNIAGKVEVNGTIYVGADTPFKYHEAFHSVFRLLLSDTQIDRYLTIAKKEVRDSLRKQGKTLGQALQEMRELHPMYMRMSQSDLEARFYEEYLADKFDEWKTNKKTETSYVNKSLFAKIIDFIKKILGTYGKNELTTLFESINAGKYRNTKVVNNRFTAVDNPSDVSQPVLKAIKIGDELIQDTIFTPEGLMRAIKVPKYLPEEEGTRLTAAIANQFVSATAIAPVGSSQEDILDEIIDKYEELYNPDRDEYLDFDNKQLKKVKDYQRVFSKIENRDIIKESVLDHLSFISKKYNNELEAEEELVDELGDRGKQNYTDGAENQGGFSSLSKYLRSWIATISYLSKDQFGNQYFLDGSPYIQAVNASMVYAGILKAVSNTDSTQDILIKLNIFREQSPEAGEVIRRFFEETNVTFDEDGQPVLNNVVNVYLFQSFIKGFGQYSYKYLFLNKDIFKGEVDIIDANRKSPGKVQMELWASAFTDLYSNKVENNPDIKIKALAVIRDLSSAMSLSKKYTDDQIIEISSKLAKNLADVLGIAISPLYISYSISASISTRTGKQDSLFSAYSNVQPITTETLNELYKIINDNEDPFMNTILEEQTSEDDKIVEVEVFRGGVTTRLEKIATANAIFDESVMPAVWTNAEGKTVYAHQLPSYPAVKLLRLQKDQGLDNELEGDEFLRGNPVITSSRFRSVLKNLSIGRIDGQKVSTLNKTEAGLIENKQLEKNKRDGITYGGYSPAEFITTLIDLYQKGNSVLDEEEEINFATSTHLIRVLEASSTANIIEGLPVIKSVKALEETGKFEITDNVKNILFDFVKQEYDRISRVQTEIISDEPIAKRHFGYNVPDNKGNVRGLKLHKMGNFLSESLQEELEQQAKDQKPISKTQELQIKKAISENLIDEINLLFQILQDENIIQLTNEGKVDKSAVSKFLSKGFITTVDKKDKVDSTRNSLYNISADNPIVNLAQVYINDFINTTSINQLMHGDHALSFKDGVDEVKRAKGDNASGQSAASDVTDVSKGIMHKFDKMHVVTIQDPTIYGNYKKGKVEVADGQTWLTTKALRYILNGFGKLPDQFVELLDKIDKGETITGSEFFGEKGKKGYVSFNAVTNSMKLVYFDGKRYLKTSAVVLTKEYTSYGEGFNQALPGREELHDLRQKLEAYESVKGRNTVGIAVPASASKMLKTNVASSISEISDDNFIQFDTNFLRLQQENPSNKIKITDPTQIKQILMAEQDDKTLVDFMGREMTVDELKQIYQKTAIARVNSNYLFNRNEIFDLSDALTEIKKSVNRNKITPKLEVFQKYAVDRLKESAADAQMIEFFELGEDGMPKYDLNNPLTMDKFAQLFLAYFSKGVLSEKVPGHSVALVSSFGNKKLKKVLELDEKGQPKRWEIVRDSEFRLNPNLYGTPKKFSDDFNRSFSDLEVGDYYIDDLRHNVAEYDKDGKITGYFTEFVMPAHFKEVYDNIKPGDIIPDIIAKSFGVRIPSQDKHSAVNLKLVDFMPVYYGSSAIFAPELIEISGADFDIDKLYMMIKEFYTQKRSGKVQFIAYGTGNTDQEKFDQYVKYQFSKNKSFRKAYSDFLKAETERKEQFEEDLNLLEVDQDFDDALDYFDLSDAKLEYFIDKKELVKSALDFVNLPSTKEDYSKKVKDLGYEAYQGALNNTIVDARMALFGNKNMVTIQSASEIITKKRKYTPENITTLKNNQVFVFGANTAGGHGGGTAGLAQRGVSTSNYTALPVGTKGKWSEYGTVDQLMEGTEGKSFGIVTKSASIEGKKLKMGSKRSVSLSRIDDSINVLIKTASENPSLEFLVTSFGTGMAGFKVDEIKSLFENKEIPNNIILPEEFEVRSEIIETTEVKETNEIPKAFQVASTKALEDVVETFKKQFGEALKNQLDEGKYNVDTLIGKYYAFKNNKEGARNIGPAVNSLLVYTLLNQNKIKVRENIDTEEVQQVFRFKFNGHEFKDYGQTRAYVESTRTYSGARIMDSLSTLISAMTDNAKERLAAKLNLNINSLGIVANMISQGVSLEDSLLFINQPIIREFYKRLAKEKSSYSFTEFTASKDKIIQDLKLPFDGEKLSGKLDTEKLEKNMNMPIITIKGETVPDLQINNAILDDFKILMVQSDSFLNIASIMKVNKGLPTNLNDFDQIMQKAENLGYGFTDDAFILSSIPLDVRGILDDKTQTVGANFRIYQEISSLSSVIMLQRTPVVKDLKKIIDNNFKINFKDKETFDNTFDKNIVSYFAIKAYINFLKRNKSSRALASLNNGMIYDETESQLPDNMDSVVDVVYKIREIAPKNYFANNFIFAHNASQLSNKDNINKVTANTWAKLNKLQVNKLQYSLMELYMDPLTRAYVVDIFHYLLVKDGGQFRSDSFIRVMPNFIFENILNQSGNAVKYLMQKKPSDLLIKSTFGASLNEMTNEFIKGYLSNSSNSYYIRPFKKLKKEIVDKIRESLNLKLLKGNEELKLYVPLDIKNTVISPNVIKNTLEINMFKNVELTREYVSTGEITNIFDETTGKYIELEVVQDVPGTTKMTEDGKSNFIFNLRYLKTFGLDISRVSDKQGIGFPLVIKFLGVDQNKQQTITYYRISKIKKNSKFIKGDPSLLLNPEDSYVYGTEAVYEKIDLQGSYKQFAAGFVIPGYLPTSVEINKNKKAIRKSAKNKGGFNDNFTKNYTLEDMEKDIAQMEQIGFSLTDLKAAERNSGQENVDYNLELSKLGIDVSYSNGIITYKQNGKPYNALGATSPKDLFEALTSKGKSAESLEDFEDFEYDESTGPSDKLVDSLINDMPSSIQAINLSLLRDVQLQFPGLSEFYYSLTEEQMKKVKLQYNIKSFVDLTDVFISSQAESNQSEKGFIDQIKNCYL